MLMNSVTVDADDVVSKLRSYITEGGYKPGDRLESERDLIVRLLSLIHI